MVRSFALCLVLSLPALARQPLHKWIDKDGVLHISDDPPPSASRSPRKVAPTAPRGRWWEKRNDAPPDQIDKAAAMFNIPAELVRAIIQAESAGDTAAISHAGAVGLMQLMPRTAGQMYVKDAVDPAQNILGGTRYLRTLANMFDGDMLLTVAAYNAGPDAVKKYGGVPPFDETRQYCKKVMAYYQELKRERERLAENGEPRK